MNIRKSIARTSPLEHLVELGLLSPEAVSFLAATVAGGLNFLVSCAKQVGKTTLLNCLTSSIGSRELAVIVEGIVEPRFLPRAVIGLP
ncbi:hypothetical protein LVY72_22565 [Arthrobacter sp. I2-34]|uniref:Uncharacterized protein n=1 Tax=Arthrobacter hankyongi TaxID=2904801 RepID=A0ABS9LDB5_9MICC|nr:hypothetical protein [Arthrobacter hankyongi]MCG2624677.1 hypothetical protein [Arthrobacter hankyongi]